MGTLLLEIRISWMLMKSYEPPLFYLLRPYQALVSGRIHMIRRPCASPFQHPNERKENGVCKPGNADAKGPFTNFENHPSKKE